MSHQLQQKIEKQKLDPFYMLTYLMNYPLVSQWMEETGVQVTKIFKEYLYYVFKSIKKQVKVVLGCDTAIHKAVSKKKV